MNTKNSDSIERANDRDLNRDPITGTPGAHPVGTGVGAAAGGAAGAAAGAIGGPPGMLAGAVIGAVVGGLAGKGVAEGINPTEEDAYWRDQYTRETYYVKDHTYDDYAPAYRTGYMAYGQHSGKRFEDVERDLELDYGKNRGDSRLGWDKARFATRAAWDRAERALPGDADRDGK